MSEVFFRTFVGLERCILEITDRDFHAWTMAIMADQKLKLDLLDLVEGRRKYDDLDEGSAGVFAERVFPKDVAIRLQQKLENYSDADRDLLTTFLLRKIIDAVRANHAE